MADSDYTTGFAADGSDVATLTKLLGHEPRAYEDFVKETVHAWQNLDNPRAR